MIRPWKASSISGVVIGVALVVLGLRAFSTMTAWPTAGEGAALVVILEHAAMNGLLVACVVRFGLFAARCQGLTRVSTALMSVVLLAGVIIAAVISNEALAYFAENGSLQSPSVTFIEHPYPVPITWLVVSLIVAFSVGITMKGRAGAA